MPEPSQLVLLEQLHTLPVGAKVRFLGCVHAYSGERACLTLRCDYPSTEPNVPTAIVNVDNVLETMKHDLLEVGAWLNIVGYVERTSEVARPARPQNAEINPPAATHVTATMIWSAGAIKLDRYEAAVQGYQKPLTPG